MSFLAAFRFLTGIPLPWWREANRQEFSRSLAYYPIVGLVIGLLLAVLYYVFSPFLPRLAEAFVLVLGMVLISGGMHLDGLADTVDGIGASHKDHDKWRNVMHDSGIGAFGVIALILDILAKVVLLAVIKEDYIVPALVILSTAGRWTMLYSVYSYPYARDAGAGSELKEGTPLTALVAGTIFTIAIALIFGWLAGLMCFLAVWLANVAMARYARKKFGGLTGDIYGAINELAEVAVLAAMLIIGYNF